MNRNELIQVIYNDTSSATCPGCNCDKPEQEGNTGECCMKCAEEQLAEYEQKIYNQARLFNTVKERRKGMNDLSDLIKEHKNNIVNFIDGVEANAIKYGYNKGIDEAKIAASKAICIGCAYLNEDCTCAYKGGNCTVSKPMLETVTRAIEELKAGGKNDQ